MNERAPGEARRPKAALALAASTAAYTAAAVDHALRGCERASGRTVLLDLRWGGQYPPLSI